MGKELSHDRAVTGWEAYRAAARELADRSDPGQSPSPKASQQQEIQDASCR